MQLMKSTAMAKDGEGSRKRVVILGGGFAGVYTAQYLEKALGRRDDLNHRTVTTAPGFLPHPHVIHFDHLVLALGNVTDFRGMRGRSWNIVEERPRWRSVKESGAESCQRRSSL